MNTLIITIIVILIIGTVTVDVITRHRKEETEHRLITLLMERKYSEFDKLANSFKAKKAVPTYNLLFLQFNSFILRGKINEANLIFKKMTEIRLNDKQILAFYGRALGFYIDDGEKDKSKACYERLKKLKEKDTEKDRLIELYDVMILNDFRHEDRILNRLSKDSLRQKISDYHMLSYIAQANQNQNKFIEYKNLEKKAIAHLGEGN